jgi:hypothetical protein
MLILHSYVNVYQRVVKNGSLPAHEQILGFTSGFREAIWIQPQDIDLSRIVHSNVIVLSSPTSRIGSLILFFCYKWKITMTSTRSILADYQRLTTLGKNCQWKTTLHCQARMRQISGSTLGVPLLFSQGLLIWGWHEMGCHGRAFLRPSQ